LVRGSLTLAKTRLGSRKAFHVFCPWCTFDATRSGAEKKYGKTGKETNGRKRK
jgi:hypothetical protein